MRGCRAASPRTTGIRGEGGGGMASSALRRQPSSQSHDTAGTPLLPRSTRLLASTAVDGRPLPRPPLCERKVFTYGTVFVLACLKCFDSSPGDRSQAAFQRLKERRERTALT
ncbi:unnamed protein product [Lota lota]